MRNGTRVIRLLCLCALAGSTGCVHLNRGEPSQRHFVLGGGTPEIGATTPSPEIAGVTLGVRRLELASYLSTPFMVVRRGPNQIGFSEFNRWGEPLEEGINRVVARTLVSRGFQGAAVAPWPAGARYDFVIQLEVVRFEGVAPEEPESVEGAVHLLATWEILRQEDGAVLARGTTDHEASGWTVGDYAGLVTLLDAGVDDLSDDLAASLEKLLAARRGGGDVHRVHPAA